MRNQRIQWIDSAKGFGILLVVYAHLFEFGTSLIYLFHMPLFFILSGITFREESLTDCLIKKGRSLLLPYIVFAILFVPLRILYLFITEGTMPPIGFHCLSRSFFDVPLWFLFALFGVTVLMTVVVKMCRNWMVYAVCLLSSVGYISASHTFGLPSLVTQVLLTFVFLYVGTLINKSLSYQRRREFLVFFVSIIVFAISSTFSRPGTDISILRVPENPLSFYASALSGGIAIISSCKLMSSIPALTKIFSCFGKQSLYIFACHWPFIQPLRLVLGDSLMSSLCIMIISITLSILIGNVLKRAIPFIFR